MNYYKIRMRTKGTDTFRPRLELMEVPGNTEEKAIEEAKRRLKTNAAAPFSDDVIENADYSCALRRTTEWILVRREGVFAKEDISRACTLLAEAEEERGRIRTQYEITFTDAESAKAALAQCRPEVFLLPDGRYRVAQYYIDEYGWEGDSEEPEFENVIIGDFPIRLMENRDGEEREVRRYYYVADAEEDAADRNAENNGSTYYVCFPITQPKEGGDADADTSG